MSTITKVDTLFADARATCAPITGVPVDDNSVRLTKLLLRLCLSVWFHGTDAGFASGIVLSNVAYKQMEATSEPFDQMTAPLAIYDPEIKSYTDDSNHGK